MTFTLIIATNASQVTDVTVDDMGIIIPGSGGSDTFTDKNMLLKAQLSSDLVALATDDAFGAGSSTLIVNDGTTNIAQNDVSEFLKQATGPSGQISIKMVLGGFLSSAGTLPLTNIGSDIISTSKSLTNLNGRRGTAGDSGTTTIELEVNGTATGDILSWTSADADFTLKTATISQSVSFGDRISFRLTSREAGNPADIFIDIS